MPKLFHLDPFDGCILNNKSAYCVVEISIQENSSSPTWKIIEKYSNPKLTQFDHSHLTYGVCVRNCEKYLNGSKIGDFKLKESKSARTDLIVPYSNLNEDQLTYQNLVHNCVNLKMMKNYQVQAVAKIAFCEHYKAENESTKNNLLKFLTLVIISLNVAAWLLVRSTCFGMKCAI